jgi:putative addiction module killer protein
MYLVQQTTAFENWFNQLRDKKAKAQILRRIERASKGNLGDISSVGGGVSELRIHFGPGYRLYFTLQNG